MNKNRLEAFSDGVLAIIITIMVLELKAPHDASADGLLPLVPVFLSYVLSFIYVGIYWNNHHHMLHTAKKVSGAVLWANLHLLFWLSLVPFTTAWMGENHFEPMPTLFYGITLLMCGFAYYVLQRLIISADGKESLLQKAIGRDWKGKSSPIFYLIAIAVCPWVPQLALAIYAGVAIMWVVPDNRIEKIYGR